MDYQTDSNEAWTQNAYEKTMTYLLDTENSASISFPFTGRGIRWIGAKENNQGIAEVTIDGGEPVEVDLCAPDVTTQNQINEILFEKTWDKEGDHIITIRRTGKKNENAIAANISLDAFMVISYADEIPITAVTVEETEKTLAVGDTYTIHAAVLPEDTTDEKTLVYTSSNEVAVSVDADGVVTAKAEGTAVITVAAFADSAVKAEVSITVSSAGGENGKTDSTAIEDAEAGLKGKDTVLTPSPNQAVTIGQTFESGNFRYKVTSVTGRTVQVIGLENKKLTAVKIYNTVALAGESYKVTSVASSVFKGNKKIKTVVIGTNVTKLGSNAFAGCTRLTKVTFGKKVTSIGKKAFYGCKKLKTISFKNTKAPKIGKQAFKGIQAKAKITVPKKMAKKQQTALKSRMKKAGAGSKAVSWKKA